MKAALTIALFLGVVAVTAQPAVEKATRMETRAWTAVRDYLTDTTIVVIPLGAQAKEHGPHLQLRNDFLIAEYLTNRVAQQQPVAIYPTVNYHFYPAFLEYPGSTSLQLETAYNLVIDLCRVISAHGPKKFYVLNTGVSTLLPLRLAQESLARQGILMRYTDILNVAGEAEKKIKQQPTGTHADEIETSMMLYMYPQTVDMSKAARDIPAVDGPGPLTLDPKNPHGRYSPTGIYGDATLATREKGRIVVEAMVQGINREISELRKAAPLVVPATQPQWEQMTGTYRLNPSTSVIITFEDGKLMMEGLGPRKTALVPLQENSFTAGTRGRLVFFRDDQGAFRTVYVSWEGKDHLGRR